MSIINDALKKVQKNLEQKNQKDTQEEDKSHPSSESQGIQQGKNAAPLQEQKQAAQDPSQMHGYNPSQQAHKHPAIKSTPSADKETPSSPEGSTDKAKKIQPNLDSKKNSEETPNINEAPPPAESQNDDQPAPQKKTPAIVIVLCFLFLGLTLATGIRLFNKPQTRSSSQKNEKAGLFGLKLDGTMMMSNKNVALINGEIYEVGDTLNSMIIKEITLDNVKLENKRGVIKTLESKK
ncbi:MAG: hypothetical protein KAR05_06370 [Candidatus Omnitrophica bacterium]|nr:hypothetical protein [Candidatus Omnitrophota bacterium]